MQNTVLALTLLGAVTIGTTAQAAGQSHQRALVHPVYWSGDYCGARCQEHRWRWHQRREAHRRWWHHRRWEERRYGYYAYPGN